VSPRWRDEVDLYLAPRRVALTRRARGRRAAVVATAEVTVPEAQAGDVGPALARLAEVLAEPAWQDAAVRAVVADHPWLRYGVVPWPTARLDAAGRLEHARFVLGDACGEPLADWTLLLADAPPGQPAVACAMPPALRPGLEAVLAPARLALVSLQPRLVVAFNAWRHRLPVGDAWFVSAEDGALAAVHLRGGAWSQVHLARLSSDWVVDLERLRAFARLTRSHGAPGQLFVDAPAWMRRADAGAGIEWLDDGTGDGAQAHELALLRRVGT